ncbi:MAG: hypothetical protein ACKOK7_06530 [Solirubrobacterales bacterium]
MSRPEGRSGSATMLLSALMLAVGVAIIVRTFSSGGGLLSLGTVFGVLFVAAGAARLYLAWRLR